jgi:hypothetical protein
MLLCVISVAWWVKAQWEDHHVFAGTIVALNSNQALSYVSNDQYFYSRLWAHQGQAMDNLNDYWFVVVSNHPVHRGEVFRLNYREIMGPGEISKAPPPPTATIEVAVDDPARFPQKYMLVKSGETIRAVPFN